MNTKEITVNDIAVSFLTRPAASVAATIIFIHGFPFNKSIWQQQLDALPDEIQGIAYDVRGHGNTTGGHRYFSVDLFAKDLIAFMEALNLQNVILCGISMGGYIALRAVERGVPQLAGLILCDTTSLPDSNENRLARFEAIEAIVTNGKAAYADKFVTKLFTSDTLENKPAIANFIKATIVANDESNICSALLALASRTDTSGVLKGIKVPVMVIRGEQDQVISFQQAEALHNNIANSEYCVIRGSGHLPNIENPGGFNRILNDFLNRNFAMQLHK